MKFCSTSTNMIWKIMGYKRLTILETRCNFSKSHITIFKSPKTILNLFPFSNIIFVKIRKTVAYICHRHKCSIIIIFSFNLWIMLTNQT